MSTVAVLLTIGRRMLTCALAATALWAGSCQQVLGVSDYAVASPDSGSAGAIGQCGGFQHASSACAACMDRECCPELEACKGSPSCDAHQSCVLACSVSDADCLAACSTHSGSPAPPSGSVDSCRARTCRSECGLTCGGAQYPSVECAACMTAHCCEAERACIEKASCSTLKCACLTGDTSCQSECSTRSPEGGPLLAAWTACQGNLCGAACEKPSWECLDVPRAWLKPKKTGTVSYTLRLLDFETFGAKVGLKVRACPATDLSCATPVAEGTTNDAGAMTLALPVGFDGYDGYMELASGPGDVDPIIPGIIHFSVSPVVEDQDGGLLRWPSRSQFNVLAALMGVVPDPKRGHIGLVPFDCFNRSARGVSFSLADPTPGSSVFYFGGQLPEAGLAETTDPVAIGGFVNVGLGSATVTGSVAATGKAIGKVTVIVREGTLTYSYLMPTP